MNILVYYRIYVHVCALVMTSQVCTKAEKRKGGRHFQNYHLLRSLSFRTDKCLIYCKIDDQPRLAVMQVISRRGTESYIVPVSFLKIKIKYKLYNEQVHVFLFQIPVLYTNSGEPFTCLF